MFIRRVSKPVLERWGVAYTAELTSACVSMRKGRTPSMATAMAVPLSLRSLCVIRCSEGFSTGRRPDWRIS